MTEYTELQNSLCLKNKLNMTFSIWDFLYFSARNTQRPTSPHEYADSPFLISSHGWHQMWWEVIIMWWGNNAMIEAWRDNEGPGPVMGGLWLTRGLWIMPRVFRLHSVIQAQQLSRTKLHSSWKVCILIVYSTPCLERGAMVILKINFTANIS